jgi:hypothetical protein
MPYIKKSDLEDLLRSAFGNAIRGQHWQWITKKSASISTVILSLLTYYEAYQQT